MSVFIFLIIFSSPYTWISNYNGSSAVKTEIAVPKGAQRTKLKADSFGYWLRNLPVKKNHPYVYLHNGKLKKNQSAHYKVIDIDVGKADLQQCADAIMRLRAEYLYSQKKFDKIAFNFTSGDKASYLKWREGYRPKIKGNKVTWLKKHKYDNSYKSFKSYLKTVFMYAGTHSLSKELPKKNIKEIEAGDILLQGGFPGHGVIVVDIAENKKTKEVYYLLAQSYMPAQEIHILKNPSDKSISPWYKLDKKFHKIFTPEWTFSSDDLKTFVK